ncbi:class I SAM-dependent methyltransferase [Bacteroidota bacterium]
MDYETSYKKVKNVFGKNPETILRNNYHLIEREGPVLDIGAGQGRHTIFLAKRGYKVDAIDCVKASGEIIGEIADTKNLSVNCYVKKFNTFKTKEDYYSAILIFGLIQDLKWDAIKLLSTRLKTWTKKDSLIFVTCWSVNDPALIKNINKWKKIGRNSYKNSNGGVNTYLEKDEILKLFKEYDKIHHWEGLGPIHRHGDGPPERHGRVEAIFRRK